MSNTAKSKRKRICIRNDIKLKIAKLKIENPRLTIEETRSILFKDHDLKDVGKSTIYDVFKNKDYWIDNQNEIDLKKYRASKGVHEALENALVIWISQKNNENIDINEEMMKKQAQLFGTQLNITNFAYSNGWINRFKTRFNLRSRKKEGEANEVTPDEVTTAKEYVRSVTSGYDKEDIFNLDETALFYEMGPNRTLSFKKISGQKLSKKRVTIALCSNSTGTFKIRPLLIHNSNNPRIFKKENFNHDLYVKFTANKKAWMTIPIFNQYLEEINDMMIKVGRNILLLVDNATSHVATKNYTNIALKFVPPKMTAHIQPMDCGIIRSFKCFYKKMLIEMLLEKSNCNTSEKMNLIDVIRFIAKAWESVSIITIRNCFRKSEIIDENVILEAPAESTSQISELFKQLHILDSVNDFVENDEHEQTEGCYTDEQIIDLVTDCKEESDSDESIDDYNSLKFETRETVKETVSHEVALDCVQKLIRHVERTCLTDNETDLILKKTFVQALENYEKYISKTKRMSMKQTNITDFMVKK